MSKLRKYFERIGFSGEGLETILSALVMKPFKKNELFVTEGKISRHLGFIESGMFQYFVLLNDGAEKTSYVSIANNFVVSLLSFIGERPAHESIRALTDGEVWVITREELKSLCERVPGFKDFYIGLLEWAICGIDSTRHDLIVLTAEQRYEKMLRDEPFLLQQIPLQYLASMLGVTPRHLSRIRSNVR